MVWTHSFQHHSQVHAYIVHVVVMFMCCFISRHKPLLVSEQPNEPSYHQAEIADDVWILVLSAVVLARCICHWRSKWSHLCKMAIRWQESASFTERVEQARLWTSLGSQCLKARVMSVALTKYISHLPSCRTIVDFMPVSFSNCFRQRNASSYDHRNGNGMLTFYWPLLYIHSW